MKTPESVSKLLGIVLRHQQQRLNNPGKSQQKLETYPELWASFTEVFGNMSYDSKRYLIAPNGHLWYLTLDAKGNLDIAWDYCLQYAIATDRRSDAERRTGEDRRS